MLQACEIIDKPFFFPAPSRKNIFLKTKQTTMKKLLFLSLIFLALKGFAQTKALKSPASYDSVLAKKLGADEYGMKRYVMAFLKDGPTPIADSAKRMELQRAHLKNIFRLADEGKLIVAGPFIDDQEVRGIFIFNVSTIEEARALTQTDPAIQAGELIMELRPWYGSAALVEINALHKAVQKKSILE
jgi:uncharacterized protein